LPIKNGEDSHRQTIREALSSSVDVWDALTSDRPYRKAWTEERVRAYIQAQSGKQFDPEVVKAFLALSPVLRG